MLHLANSLWNHKRVVYTEDNGLSNSFKEENDPIPFLVLEPAKREYRELARYDIPDLIILSPSASTLFPMRLNLFEFPKGLTLSEHISKLCQVFEGAFPIASPAPFILDKFDWKKYSKRREKSISTFLCCCLGGLLDSYRPLWILL